MRRKIIKGIFVVVCMLVIFLFSSDTSVESTAKSEDVILEVTSIFGLSSKEEQAIIDMFFVPVRKSAHFFIYFILGNNTN